MSETEDRQAEWPLALLAQNQGAVRAQGMGKELMSASNELRHSKATHRMLIARVENSVPSIHEVDATSGQLVNVPLEPGDFTAFMHSICLQQRKVKGIGFSKPHESTGTGNAWLQPLELALYTDESGHHGRPRATGQDHAVRGFVAIPNRSSSRLALRSLVSRVRYNCMGSGQHQVKAKDLPLCDLCHIADAIRVTSARYGTLQYRYDDADFARRVDGLESYVAMFPSVYHATVDPQAWFPVGYFDRLSYLLQSSAPEVKFWIANVLLLVKKMVGHFKKLGFLALLRVVVDEKYQSQEERELLAAMGRYLLLIESKLSKNEGLFATEFWAPNELIQVWTSTDDQCDELILADTVSYVEGAIFRNRGTPKHTLEELKMIRERMRGPGNPLYASTQIHTIHRVS